MSIHFKYGFSILLFLVSINSAFAQIIVEGSKTERRQKAAQYLTHLETAGIVVRLPTNHKQIARMEDLIAKSPLNDPNRQRLTESIAYEQQEAKEKQEMLVRIFQNHYTRGPVYFMADSSYLAFVDDPSTVVYWNSQLQPDTNISGPGPNGLVMHVDYISASASALTQDLVLTDRTRRVPAKPFPEVMSRMGTVFSDKENTYINLLQKWSQRLDALAVKIEKWSNG